MLKIILIILLGATTLFFFTGDKLETTQIEDKTTRKLGVVSDDIATLKADTTLNGQLDTILSVIATRQSNYIKTSDVYFQGLSTHSVPPTYGSPAIPDKLALKPHYQTKNWTDFGQSGVSLPVAIRINQMVYPNRSKGYQVVFLITLNNNRYSKTQGYGLQADQFTHDWEYAEKVN